MKKIKFSIVTLFPELIESFLRDALLSKAIKKDLLEISTTDLRKFSQNNYQSVDDTIFGGGDGMLICYKPVAEALKSLGVGLKSDSKNSKKKIIYLSPQGRPWTAAVAKEFSELEEIVLVAGRYAGMDQRVIHDFIDEEISIGDYVLSGGELAALVMIEYVSRFIPGVLGDSQSAFSDSFENGLLEAPQFTKAQVENGHGVPGVLLSGNHKNILEWRTNVSILVTLKKRPDLLEKKSIPWKTISDFYKKMCAAEKEILDLQNVVIPNA